MRSNDWIRVLLAAAVGIALVVVFVGVFIVALNSEDPADFIVSETAITAAFTLMGAIVSGLVISGNNKDRDDSDEAREEKEND